jgi:hypothetical protein
VAKQLLYLTNHQLSVHVWERGNLSDGPVFHNNPAGWAAFADYLGQGGEMPTYLLGDLIEEDFQRDTLPHVMGQRQRALLQRRLLQLYRDTPYRHASIQARLREGRRDDVVLLGALTNATLPQPWLSAMLRYKVPLAGFFSLALLGDALFKRLRLVDDALLLITHQSSGLRHSFFHQGQLLFSRLTPLADGDQHTLRDTVMLETAKTRQFLAGTRDLARDQLIHVVILAGDDTLQPLAPHCQDTPTTAYRLIKLQDAARQIGLNKLDGLLLCERLFLAMLADKAPAGHYPVPEQTQLYRLWRARAGLHGLSMATVAGGLLWAGAYATTGWGQYQQIRDHGVNMRAIEAQHQALVRDLPATPVSPHDMKSAVDAARLMTRNVAGPEALLKLVSRAAQAVPQVSIDRLRWSAGEPPVPDAGAGKSTQAAEPGLSGALAGIPSKPAERVVVDGEIVPFRGEFRPALEILRRFAEQLETNQHVTVEIISAPVNLQPTVRLEGGAGGDRRSATAPFSLKLTWKP